MSSTHRIAAIDIGTNSAHLVVADFDSGGEMRLLETDKITLQLGFAIDDNGCLREEAIVRTAEAVKNLAMVAKSYDAAVRAVATHATRQAKNHAELLDKIYETSGIRVEVIDGTEEARLSFLGMRCGFSLEDLNCLAVDIGGGSTELLLGRNDKIDYSGSFKIGAVGLTDRFAGENGNGKTGTLDVAGVKAHVKTRLAPIPRHIRELGFEMALASSGTAKAIGRIYQRTQGKNESEDINGLCVPDTDLKRIVKRLIELESPEAIAKEFAVSPTRARILTPGALILHNVGQIFGVREWVISTWGLREGIVADALHRHKGRPAGRLPNAQWYTVKKFAKRLGVTKGQHHKHVADLAQSLFDQFTSEIHQQLRGRPLWLSAVDRDKDGDLLRGAAWLHECGKFLSGPKYHRHSYYLITNSRLPGFTNAEKHMMALVARYHRKSLPRADGQGCEDLSENKLDRLIALAAILRLASSLDRGRQGLVKAINLELAGDEEGPYLTVDIRHAADRAPELEFHKVQLEQRALEKSFGCRLKFRMTVMNDVDAKPAPTVKR